MDRQYKAVKLVDRWSSSMERLYKAVKLVESGDNPLAVRFEPLFMQRIQDKDKTILRAKNHIYAFTPSLKAYLSFSVGRCQFMVYNLYFTDELYEYLKAENLLPVAIPYVVDDRVERELFKIFVAKRMPLISIKLSEDLTLNESDLRLFSRLWNGSVEYAEKLRRHYV